MSADAGKGQGRGDPVRLRCKACAEALGSEVLYCPFCGVIQVAATLPARPAAPPDAAPAASAGLPPPKPPVGAAEPAAGIPLPPPTGALPATTRERPAPSSAPGVPVAPRTPWKRRVTVLAAIALGVVVLRSWSSAPRATLVVQVRAASGAAIAAGRILVDDRDAGAPGQSLTVEPGSHRIAFQEPSWLSEPRLVTLAKDASVTVSVTVQEAPARVNVTTSPPGGTIRIQGRNYGKAPLSLSLNPGSYDVSAALAGHVGKAVPVTLARGELRNLGIDLAEVPPPPASPPVRSLPAPFDRGVVLAITALQSSPARDADTLGTLPSLSEVQVQAQVVALDETWLQVRANGRQGFVRANRTVEPWESWSQRNVMSGLVDAVTSDLRVVIAGNGYPLAGVQAPERSLSGAAGLARASSALGGMLRGAQARCVPRDTISFQCKTADGRDIGELYLLNGGAVVGSAALPYYADAQRTARDKQKGLWAD